MHSDRSCRGEATAWVEMFLALRVACTFLKSVLFDVGKVRERRASSTVVRSTPYLESLEQHDPDPSSHFSIKLRVCMCMCLGMMKLAGEAVDSVPPSSIHPPLLHYPRTVTQ